MAIAVAGDWALVGWALISLFGIALAYVFARIGILLPGEGGAANAVEYAFGPAAKQFSAYALICALFFGPAAVVLTIVTYLPPEIAPQTELGQAVAGGIIQVVCAGLILSGLRNMSRITLVLASSATGLLLTGAGLVLVFHSQAPTALPEFDSGTMGYTMLLLFWAVVGWEVVGNYGDEVVDPRRTVPRAAILAACIIGLVFMAVAAGLQYGQFPVEAGHGVAALLYPLFGVYAPWVNAAMTAGLCMTTYLVVVGAVSRLVAHLSQETGLPDVLNRRNCFGIPWVVITGYTCIHLFLFCMVGAGFFDLAMLVAVADGFFLTNALLCTVAAVRIFSSPLPKGIAGILSLGILAVLLQSHWQVIVVIGFLAFWVMTKARRSTFLARFQTSRDSR